MENSRSKQRRMAAAVASGWELGAQAAQHAMRRSPAMSVTEVVSAAWRRAGHETRQEKQGVRA